MSDISRRKADHLDLATSGDVGFKKTTTLFECVRLVHDALPDLEFAAIEVAAHIIERLEKLPSVAEPVERDLRPQREVLQTFARGDERPVRSADISRGFERLQLLVVLARQADKLRQLQARRLIQTADNRAE